MAVDIPGGALTAQSMPPAHVIETRPAVEMTNPSEGVYIFDLGQTITGWGRLRVRGPAGATVMLRHGTCLYADGTLDARSNLYNAPDSEEDKQGISRDGEVHHGARQTDSYTLRGDGVEVWEPRFTLHSFRYVEVTGYPGIPDLESLEGRVVHTAVGSESWFRCSNELFNRIHSNVHWTLRGSFQSISQDAADRSERVAWLGDPGFIAEDYLYNFDSASFWAKWLEDIHDAQKEDGDVPVVAPLALAHDDGRVSALDGLGEHLPDFRVAGLPALRRRARSGKALRFAEADDGILRRAGGRAYYAPWAGRPHGTAGGR